MARETRIGIALMVLLVGVFGAIVYKKWNGRQPTVLAAASEETLGEPSKIAEVSDKAELNKGETKAPPAAEENPFTADEAGGFGSYKEASPSPMAQAEPMPTPSSTPVQEDPFSFTEVAESNAALQDHESTPIVEPAPESVFADATSSESSSAAPFETTKSVDAAPEGTVASTPPAPIQPTTLNDDPFADPFGDAADTTDADEKVATMTVDDDPFAAPVSADATSAEPISDAESVSKSFASETQVGPEVPGAAPFVSTEEVASGSDITDDPFSNAPAQATEVAKPETRADSPQEFASTDSSPSVANDDVFSDSGAPAEFVPEETATSVDGFQGGFDEEFDLDGDAESTSQLATVPSEEEPIASSSSQPRSDYHIVADNESYWTISKKIYGTSAYYHALAQFNIDRIKDPNRLKAGWKVLTPTADELRAKFPQLVASVPHDDASTASHNDKPGFLLDAQGRPCYRVGDSDTLGGIAQVHLGRASRWVQIYELNRTSITNPKSLKPGTVLRLPPDASRVRLVPEG